MGSILEIIRTEVSQSFKGANIQHIPNRPSRIARLRTGQLRSDRRSRRRRLFPLADENAQRYVDIRIRRNLAPLFDSHS